MVRPRSPTLQLQAVFAIVFVVEMFGGILGLGPGWFALSNPTARPWTIVTSVYAHASLRHLLANAIALAILGSILERSTTQLRFHVFFLVTGAFAGLAEVLIRHAFGQPAAVIGASGAVLALAGYAVTGNPATGWLLTRVQVSRRTQLVLYIGLAVLVTAATAATGVALIAHFTGFLLGLVAGRAHLLSPRA